MKYSITNGAIQDKNYISKVLTVVAATLLSVSVVAVTAQAKPNNDDNKTTVPGHSTQRHDANNNGYPDADVYVNGHYTAVYAYDDNSQWYWDLGDGRVLGTASSIEELDQETLTVCNYVNNYRADFGDTPYMDSGWIQNHIKCSGYDDNGTYNYLIVHRDDPRWTGEGDQIEDEGWGPDWEYHVLTQSGEGNLMKAGPQTNI